MATSRSTTLRPPPAPVELLTRAERWDDLSPWERAELGRALRRLGWTYGEIRAHIPVPKGTLAGWCREIHLTGDQVAAIKARTNGGHRGVPRDTQRKRRRQVAKLRREARRFAEAHVDDPLFVAGTVLYWAEGDKTKRQLAVANSDPAALRLFTGWTRRFHEPQAEFVLALNLHHDNDEPAARRWWADRLGFADPDFTKTYMKPAGTGHRKNHLPHGVCRVRMRRSADAFLRTTTWIDVLRERLGADGTPWQC